MSAWSDLPILEACRDSYPDRPQIDPATMPWTREELSRRIDSCMDLLNDIARG
jgi:hypothetical protein